MNKFAQALEDARYEVNIELYPHGLHYQIFKPECPDRHCWEVYRNPRSDLEVELTGCANDLEEAIGVMSDDVSLMTMEGRRWTEYSDAVDMVCLNCLYATGMECETCMVRKSMDRYRKIRSMA